LGIYYQNTPRLGMFLAEILPKNLPNFFIIVHLNIKCSSELALALQVLASKSKLNAAF